MSGMRTRHRAASATAATTLITLMLALAGCGPLAAGVASPTVGPSLLSPGAAGPLIGAWVSEVTREDLRAGGLTAEGLLDENSGRFTMTFNADGTWRQVQESLDGAPVSMPVFEGRWEVAGDQLIQDTTFPEQYAGDRVELTWRVEDGQLHLAVPNPPDPILPVVIGAHPWTPATP
jgi:hypothetical protein